MDAVYSFALNLLAPGVAGAMCWTMEGTEHIPLEGPVIIASNHSSYLDPISLAWVADARRRKVRFLAKEQLFSKPGFGQLLSATNQIPVARGKQDAANALNEAVGALHDGACVAVFPEGTISLDLEPMVGKTGTARLAQQAGVAVTPVGMWGAHRIMFKGRRPNPEPFVAQVAVVGAPILVAPDDDIREATDRIMQGICDCVQRARSIYPQRPRRGDDWWWRDPQTAQLRSCLDVPGLDAPGLDAPGLDTPGDDR